MGGIDARIEDGDGGRAGDADAAVQLVPANVRQRPLVGVGGVGGSGLDGARPVKVHARDLGECVQRGQLIGVFAEVDAAHAELRDGALVGDAGAAEDLELARVIGAGGEGDEVRPGAGGRGRVWLGGCRGRVHARLGRRLGRHRFDRRRLRRRILGEGRGRSEYVGDEDQDLEQDERRAAGSSAMGTRRHDSQFPLGDDSGRSA